MDYASSWYFPYLYYTIKIQSSQEIIMLEPIFKLIPVKNGFVAQRFERQCCLFDYIEIYYNRVRRHSANGWLSSEAFEQKHFKSLEEPTVHNTV